MGIVLLFVFGIALIAAPVTASALGHPLGTLATAVMLVFGSGLTLLAGILGTITKLYQKTKANEALVRTGMGGMKVITDGGALIIPVVHTLVRVSLATQKLVVARKAKEALLTEDKLRADVTAEFYVRVQPLDDSIKNAARSFGDQMGDSKTVTALVADKLVSALRTVAATMTLEDLNKARDQFVRQVTEIVKPDLEHNGLTLEGVTISELDQTDLTSLSENNIFDAQGRAAVARIVQAKKTEVNQLQKEGDQARAKQDLETAKRLLEFAQDQATATAQQAAEVAKVTAEQDRIAKEAEIATTKAVELANIEQAKQTEVATRAKQQAVETAEREKQAAIADAQAKQAEAEAKLATAEALRETERQAVKTVQVEADANRAKTTQVINAEATAQTAYVQAQKAADAQAYTMKAKADGQKAAADAEAEATIKKASADAEATTKRANAEAAAAEARARGEQAVAMVPVSVASAQVDV